MICRMGAPDIFFSYAREDGARVAPVVAALEARGWSVFWDRRIPAGQTWRSHIGRALEQARCAVVAWSTHSIQSEWVIEEADDGRERGILVPAFLDPVRPPRGFRGIQAADLSGWSPERPSPAFDSFLDDLDAALSTSQQGPSSPSPAAETSRGEQIVGDGDEPITPQQIAVLEPVGGDSVANPLAGSIVDAPHTAEMPALPAGQPAHASDAIARREVEVELAPLAVEEERLAAPSPPSGPSQLTEATYSAPFGAVPAELARSSAVEPKKAGRWWLGTALVVVGAISAGSYAYFGPSPAPMSPKELAQDVKADAEQGDAVAQFNLGLMYAKGIGLAKDEAEAARWYRKAADQGDADAQNSLGVMYGQGLGGLAKDEAEAARWFRKAADQGDADAQNNLGQVYEYGLGGLAKDEAEAARWYRKAADQGHADAKDGLARLGRAG